MTADELLERASSRLLTEYGLLFEIHEEERENLTVNRPANTARSSTRWRPQRRTTKTMRTTDRG
jgi:hypothetical protein